MKRSIQFSFLMTLMLILVACGGDDGPSGPEVPDDPPGSTTGILEVTASTSGDDQDSDGYTVLVDGDSVNVVDSSGTITVEDLEEDSYDVELAGVRANCAVDSDNPQSANIAADETLTISFDVSCEAAISNKIVYTSNASGNNEIYVMNTDGSDPAQITDNSDAEYSPQISPDGTKILFVKKTGGPTSNWQYFTINVDGSGEQELTTAPEGASISLQPYATWSPDGSEILFNTDRDGNPEIYKMNADGSDQTRITDNSADDTVFKGAYLADGSQFVFTSTRASGGDEEIFIADADGSNIQQLTDNSVRDFSATFSPVSSDIAFVSDRDSSGPSSPNQEVYTMDNSGDNVQRLTNQSNIDASPAWSADGSSIAFDSNRNGDFEIFTISSDGSTQPSNLTNDNANNERSPSQSLLE